MILFLLQFARIQRALQTNAMTNAQISLFEHQSLAVTEEPSDDNVTPLDFDQGRTPVPAGEPFQTKHRGIVFIETDEMSMTSTVRTAGGDKIGSIEFDLRDDHQVLYLMWAHLEDLPGYTRIGIGRECVRRMSDIFSLPVSAADNDGMRRDDGSHLTGDAPAFVEALKREGLILPSSADRYDLGDD